MIWILPMVILAAGPAAPIADQIPGGKEMFRSMFDESSDVNYDTWPDGWTRRRGPGFPHWLPIAITNDPGPHAQGCLRIDLDGGAAVAFSPTVPAASLYDYILEVYVSTAGLVGDKAFVSLGFLDGGRRRLEEFRSRVIGGTSQWQVVRLGPVSPQHPAIRGVVAGLHVEPDGPADLAGTARFAEVRITRLPRLVLTMGSRHHVFADPQQANVSIQASGIDETGSAAVLELENVLGQCIARQSVPLKVRNADVPVPPPATPEAVSAGAEHSDGTAPEAASALVAEGEWLPPIPGPGFYRVRALLNGPSELSRQTSLAVVSPPATPTATDFGWSLPRGAEPLGWSALAELVGEAGIGCVKLPMWVDEADGQSIGRLTQLAEQLSQRGIVLVGMLDTPPAAVRAQLDPTLGHTAAEVLASDAKLWGPGLRAVLARLGIYVRLWQLGADDDTSLARSADVAQRIAAIKGELGPDTELGLSWDWMQELPHTGAIAPPWRFVCLSGNPPLTRQELAVYLGDRPPSDVERWVVLQPLAKDRYPLESRVADLVHRMMAAKTGGASIIFAADPFGADGLMNPDGTPGELLLPWRTTALELGGREPLGSVDLPGGSPNQVFAGEEDAVMVVWNDVPVDETAWLGHDVKQLDVFGNSRVPAVEDGMQTLPVQRVPTFVTGVDPAVVRWRQQCVLDSDRIPSVLGERHSNTLRVKNSFPQGTSGRFRLVVPDDWSVEPRSGMLRLAAGETWECPLEIQLPYNVVSGRHPVRVEFDLETSPPTRFSVYRWIDVGFEGLSFELAARLNAQGEVEVEQRLLNETAAAVRFRCYLYAPDRRRMEITTAAPPRGQDSRIYRLADGADLTGKTLWIRAEETGGSRVLNYRVAVGQ